MSDKNKDSLDKQNEKKNQEEENELDKELRQTFPASDPPAQSRPGHERTEEDKQT